MMPSVVFGLMLLPWPLAGAHRAQPEASECVMLQMKASNQLSPSSEMNSAEAATLNERATVTNIGEQSAASTAKVAVLDEDTTGSKDVVSPAEVACGQVVQFNIEQGGDRYRPTVTGGHDLRVTLSTVASGLHADTTLSDTRIFGPCANDDFWPGTGPRYFSECSFHSQTETVTVNVGGYSGLSGLAYLEVRCEEWVPPPPPPPPAPAPPAPAPSFRCSEFNFWPGWSAPSCSECPTVPRPRGFSHPYNNGNNNGLCQGDCRWNNPTTHDTCVPMNEGASGYCPSECRQSSSRYPGPICHIPDSYANKYTMPPGDRICYHSCMQTPDGHFECGDSDWYFRRGGRPLWCCGCAPVGFQYGSAQGPDGCGEVAELLQMEPKEPLQDSGAGE